MSGCPSGCPGCDSPADRGCRAASAPSDASSDRAASGIRSERGDSGDRGGKVDAEWRAAFLEFPDRFLVGTDTFAPERWHYVVEHANWSRKWLQDLPPAIAEKIAYRNGEAIFGSLLAR